MISECYKIYTNITSAFLTDLAYMIFVLQCYHDSLPPLFRCLLSGPWTDWTRSRQKHCAPPQSDEMGYGAHVVIYFHSFSNFALFISYVF